LLYNRSQIHKIEIMWKWSKWVLLLLVLAGTIVLALTISSSHQNKENTEPTENVQIILGPGEETRTFTTDELQAANIALKNGIIIEDPENDFYPIPHGTIQKEDNRPDNSDPYPIPWTDLKSVNIGADKNYLYVKSTFWGQFPNERTIYNGDLVWGSGVKLTNFKFKNKESKIDSADMSDTIRYDNEPIPGLLHSAMISPTITVNFELQFKTTTGEGMITGGPGFDYILAAYPLKNYDLKLGDEVTFDASSESGSDKFHHEAIDLLLDQTNSKFGKTLIYKIGSNTYSILSNPDQKDHS